MVNTGQETHQATVSPRRHWPSCRSQVTPQRPLRPQRAAWPAAQRGRVVWRLFPTVVGYKNVINRNVEEIKGKSKEKQRRYTVVPSVVGLWFSFFLMVVDVLPMSRALGPF